MMTGSRARLLEDLIADLVAGVAGATPPGAGVRPVSIEFNLPMEMRVVDLRHAGDPNGQVAIRADVPQTRTRTPFDLPVGRLALRVSAEMRR